MSFQISLWGLPRAAALLVLGGAMLAAVASNGTHDTQWVAASDATASRSDARQLSWEGYSTDFELVPGAIVVQYETATTVAERGDAINRNPTMSGLAASERLDGLDAEVFELPADRVVTDVSALTAALRADPVIATATPMYSVRGQRCAPLKELFIQFVDGADESALDAILAENALQLIEESDWTTGNYIVRSTDASPDALDIVERVQQRADIAFCAPNFFIWRLLGDEPNDPEFANQWHLQQVSDADIDAPEGWAIETGCDLIIAIVDSGLDTGQQAGFPAHPDLKNRIWTNPGEIAGDGIDNDGNGFIDDIHGWDFRFGDNDPTPGDRSAHGTFVSGIAGAETHTDPPLGVAGVTWKSRIMVVRGLNDMGGSELSLTQSLVYAWKNGASVINNSWGGWTPLPQARRAAQAAQTQGRGGLGAVVVFIAHNDANDPGYPGDVLRFPAEYPESFSVGATDRNDNWAVFSNYGKALDVVAPGEDVRSTDLTGADGYDPGDYANSDGTSFAAPHVSGLAGLLICQYSDYTAQQIRARIEHTCDRVTPPHGGYDAVTGHNKYMGYGRINMYRALSGKPQVVSGSQPSSYEDWSDEGGALYKRVKHANAAYEFLGSEYSPENSATDSDDPDGKENEDQKDAFDDGVRLQPPYFPGTDRTIEVMVTVENPQGPRYMPDPNDPTKNVPVIINVWFDWTCDGFDTGDDWVVKNKKEYPATWGTNRAVFTYQFTVPSTSIQWHIQDQQDGQFLNVRVRLTYKDDLKGPNEDADFGEVEDHRCLNFVEMFDEDEGYMSHMKGCAKWRWIGDNDPSSPCHPAFIPDTPPNGYMTSEPYIVGAIEDAKLRTPGFDLSELTEAFLEFDYSAIEGAYFDIDLYRNGNLVQTVANVNDAGCFCIAGCVVHYKVDLSSWCDDGNTDISLVFRTLEFDCDPFTGYQDGKFDNVVVWGIDRIKPDLTGVNQTPTGEFTADLDFSSPGDDGPKHVAELFNLRYGPRFPTYDEWRHALWLRKDQIVGSTIPVPAAPGTVHKLQLQRFHGAQHFHMIKTLDEVTWDADLVGGGSNNPPVLTAPTCRVAVKGIPLTFAVTATDPDFDHVTLWAENLPGKVRDPDPNDENSQFTDNGNNSGVFLWTPDASDVGKNWSVDLWGRDAAGQSGGSATIIEVDAAWKDCNFNGLHDADEICLGVSPDCNNNRVPDACDIRDGTSKDCNLDGIPDECQTPTTPSSQTYFMNLTSNGRGWAWEVRTSTVTWYNHNVPGLPVGDGSDKFALAFIDSINAVGCKFLKAESVAGWPNAFKVTVYDTTLDAFAVGPPGGRPTCTVPPAKTCWFNPTFYELVPSGADCNANGQDDTYDIADGSSSDCNANVVPDECEGAAWGPVLFVNAAATGANDGTSWADAMTDLALAIHTAQCCGTVDEIWVGGGTYAPAGPGSPRGATFFLARGVAIYGGFAGTETQRDQRDPATNTTILSGDLLGDDSGFSNNTENAYQVVIANGVDSTAVLDGFTIAAGNADGPSDGSTYFYDAGGGIRMDHASPTIRDCRFAGNHAIFGGGAELFFSSPLIDDCRFDANAADQYGGALHNNRGNPVLRDCVFTDNAATEYGGAFRYISGGGSAIGLTISGNTAKYGGGAAFDRASSPIVVNAVLRENVATKDGGALFLDRGSSPSFTGAIIEGNRAVNRGGGALIGADSSSKPTFTNASVNHNRADAGGGLHVNNAAPTFANSILYYNEDSTGGGEAAQLTNSGGSVALSYSDVAGLTGGFGGVGNIDGDPLFDDAGDWSDPGTPNDWTDDTFIRGDLRLTANSPCIDAANNAAVPADTFDLDGDSNTGERLPFDFGGDPRFADDPGTTDSGNGSAPLVDMGSFEFQGSSSRRADMNCDAAVDFDDIDPFVTALISRDDYESQYPDCNYLNADINQDGSVNFDDIDGFVECLINGECP